MTDRDIGIFGGLLFSTVVLIMLMLSFLLSINNKTDNINKQLKTIVKLEERQNAKTPETTTPELVIEENTLGR